MSKIKETVLPGIGKRFDIDTEEGKRLGVIEHRAGRHDLVVYHPEDPDSCQHSYRLTENEARDIAGLLGAPTVEVSDERQSLPIGDLAIDWITIPENLPCAGKKVRSADFHEYTGVMIIAVLRGEETIPTPDAEFQIEVGDTLMVVGQVDKIEEAFKTLESADAPVYS